MIKSVSSPILTAVVFLASLGVVAVIIVIMALVWIIAAFVVALAFVGIGIVRAYRWGRMLKR